MSYVGDFALGSTLDIKFCTVTTTGAPTQLAGTPVVSAYVDNSLTQITAGITLTVDFDAVTGLNNVRVVATGANGYATASNYQLVITTGTVGGTSVVGYVLAQFSIENRSSLRPTTAGRTLDVSAGGEAGVDWANVGTPGSTVGLSATTVATVTTTTTATNLTNAPTSGDLTATMKASVNTEVDNALDTAIPAVNTATSANDILLDVANARLLGTIAAGTHTAQTGDSFTRLGAPAGASVSADIATRATPAQVNTEVLDVLNTDTFAEPGQATPAATNTLVNKISFLYKYLRNRITVTATTISVFNDDATTVGQKSTHSDDAVTYDRGEFTTGP